MPLSKSCSKYLSILLLISAFALIKNFSAFWRRNLSVNVISNIAKYQTKIRKVDNQRGEKDGAQEQNSPSAKSDGEIKSSKIPSKKAQTQLQSQPGNKILFITEYRSGSTFLSTILNKNKDVFYLFEPLYLSTANSDRETLEKQHEILLNFYYNCTVPLTSKYLEAEEYQKTVSEIKEKATSSEKSTMLHYCVTEGICFRHKTDTFKQPPFCPVNHFEEGLTGDRLQKICPNFKKSTLPLAQNVCRDKKTVATKVIRVWKLSSLPEKIKNDQDFKVLYLVRDPRGLANSRFHTTDEKWTEANTKKLKSICSNFDSFINEKKKDTLNLKFKLKAVRYEDFAVNPINMTKSLNTFLKLDDDKNVFETLDRITHNDQTMLDKGMLEKLKQEEMDEKYYNRMNDGVSEVLDDRGSHTLRESEGLNGSASTFFKEDKSRKVTEIDDGDQGHDDDDFDPRLDDVTLNNQSNQPCTFCVVRDTKSNLFHWRKSLKWDQVNIIQEACSLMMDSFGYRKFTQEEYKLMRNRDDFMPILEECLECG